MRPDLPGIGPLLRSPAVLEATKRGRPWLLALDYDGTLAPFRPERDQAYPYEQARDILRRLPTSGPCRFLIVSGRECGSVSKLLGVTPPPEIWGCHGLQRLTPGGGLWTAPLTPAQLMALSAARESVAGTPALEPKPCSVALHWRGASLKRRTFLETEVRPLWESLAREGGMELHAFDGGIELRPPGLGKGAAMQALARENPDAAIFYLGDDATDEDAFKALGDRGVGVLVRAEPRPTAAAYRITPPEELIRFLEAFAPAGGQKNGRYDGKAQG